MSWARIFTIYTGSFIAFTILLAILEYVGAIGKTGIGYTFLIVTIGVYALIGVLSRTAKPDQYYVAGRGVPAFFNGMATGADWMSAASFISMAGAFYATGFDGLAYVTGWTGGYVLLAVYLAPYLRKFGAYTIPDFLALRYGGNAARVVGLLMAIGASFTYLIAQITGVGIIMGRFLGSTSTWAPSWGSRDPGLLHARRHAGGDLDPGGAVHHPDPRLHHAGGHALLQALRRAAAGVHLRPRAPGHHRRSRRSSASRSSGWTWRRAACSTGSPCASA